MDSESSSTRIEKLNSDNYYAWKQKIEHLLVLKDLWEYVEDDAPTSDSIQPQVLATWRKNDRKCRAIISLTLSDQILENVRNSTSAKDTWLTIRNVFERHTLLNKLAARRKFYTATLGESETILEFANRMCQLAATLKSMNVDIPDSELAMALLNGLPEQYAPIITALDAIGDDDDSLSFDFVKARIMQEEQRIKMRLDTALAKSEQAALLSYNKHSQRPKCNHCSKVGHFETKCWKKFPHLNPHKKSRKPDSSLVVNEKQDDEPVICLMTKHHERNTPKKSTDWFIDSGCTAHMTYDRSAFTAFNEEVQAGVELGNQATSMVMGHGDINITLLVEGQKRPCILKNVLYVPDLGFQLISVKTLNKSSFEVVFKNGICHISKKGSVIATGSLKNNLYKLNTWTSDDTALIADINLWHKRLAHVDPTLIKSMASNHTATGLKISDGQSTDVTCSGCIFGKAHRSIIPKKAIKKSESVLDLVHSDVNGPLEVPSMGGSRYFITFIDDHSKWIVAYPMKNKSESFDCFKQYHKYAETHTGNVVKMINFVQHRKEPKLKKLRTDNGGEYLSDEFRSYLLLSKIA